MYDSVAYLMLFHIILQSRNSLPLSLSVDIDNIMKSFGNQLHLLHYWKREFKATDETTKFCDI